jgi:hypothetical protein
LVYGLFFRISCRFNPIVLSCVLILLITIFMLSSGSKKKRLILHTWV